MSKCIDNLPVCQASCCRYMVFYVGGYLMVMMRDYYVKHGCKVTSISHTKHKVLVPSVCAQLDKKTNLCKLHGTFDKPFLCVRFGEESKGNRQYEITPGCIYGKKA